MAAEVVDMRPDRFLRAMRETGDWFQACEKAQIASEDVEKLCENPKFDLAQVECQLEYIEEQMIEKTEAAILQARKARDARISTLRDQATARFKERHPNGC